MRLEKLVEHRLVREIEPAYDLLDGHVGILEQVLRLEDHESIYPVRSGTPADSLDQFGKILRRKAELLGIESHIALRSMIISDKTEELVINVLGLGRRSVRLVLSIGKAASPDGTKVIGNG